MSYRFLGLAINYDDLNKMQVFLYRLSKRGRDFWPKWLVEKAANIIKRHVWYYAPERTGALRRSIEVEVIPPSGAVVVVGVEYAPYVEAGTRPHMIYPRKPGGVLRLRLTVKSYSLSMGVIRGFRGASSSRGVWKTLFQK